MQTEDNENYTEDEGYDIEIYSRNAIFWFSLIFSPIFGGVMLAINLRSAGYMRAALQVVLFSVAYYFMEGYAITIIGFKPDMTIRNSLIITGSMLAMNLVGALVQTQYFFKRYFPDNDYYPKSILRPIIVVIILVVINLLFMMPRV